MKTAMLNGTDIVRCLMALEPKAKREDLDLANAAFNASIKEGRMVPAPEVRIRVEVNGAAFIALSLLMVELQETLKSMAKGAASDTH